MLTRFKSNSLAIQPTIEPVSQSDTTPSVSQTSHSFRLEFGDHSASSSRCSLPITISDDVARTRFAAIYSNSAPTPLSRSDSGVDAMLVRFNAIREKRMKKNAAGAVATINLSALRRNFRLGIALLGEKVTPAAVVKADGYGLSAIKIAETLIEEGCKDFFVARIGEGVDLRNALRKQDHPMADKVAIYVLDGHLDGADPQMLIDHRVTPVLNSLAQIHAWNKAGKKLRVKLPAILQFNSGMNRAGIPHEEFKELIKHREDHLMYINSIYVMTHLANAGDVNLRPGEPPVPCDATKQQLAAFNKICAYFPRAGASIGASSTVFLGQEYHKDMVRMGGVLHGRAPFDHGESLLEPILTLKTKISQVCELQPSDQIGYGLTFTAPGKMTVATIPFGFADGVPRAHNGNRTGDPTDRPFVLVAGKYKAPLVGTISMDQSSIDLTNVPQEFRKEGTPVTLMGEGMTPGEFGKMFGTIASETQSKLTGRVYKEFVEDKDLQKPAADDRASPNAWAVLDILESKPDLRRRSTIW